jgi:hypothetical protein
MGQEGLPAPVVDDSKMSVVKGGGARVKALRGFYGDGAKTEGADREWTRRSLVNAVWYGRKQKF